MTKAKHHVGAWVAAAALMLPVAGALAEAPREQFVACGAIIELKSLAIVAGPEVRLSDVARWNGAGAAYCEPLANVVVARVSSGQSGAVSMDQVRRVLAGAAVPLGSVRLQGPASVEVRVLAATPAAQAGGGKPTAAAEFAAKPEARAAETPANTIEPVGVLPAGPNSLPGSAAAAAASPEAAGGVVARRTVRQIIETDVVNRLRLEPNELDVQLESPDRTVLELAEPACQITVTPRMLRKIGPAAWGVSVRQGDVRREYEVRGVVRQWVSQVVAARPIAQGQEFSTGDVEVRRVLMDRAPADKALEARDGVVGQAASRSVMVGQPITPRMLEPLMLIQPNQPITVVAQFGGVEVRTAMRSLSAGAMGQMIGAKNEATRQIINVEVTGPQQARVVGGGGSGGGSAVATAANGASSGRGR